MARPYTCPVCRGNNRNFSFIFKLAQEIVKDPDSGATTFIADELETVTRPSGEVDLDIRCEACGYIGPEQTFALQARRRPLR